MMTNFLFARKENALMSRADLPIIAGILVGFFYFIDNFAIATLFLAVLIANVTRLIFRFQAISHPFTEHKDVDSVTKSPNKLFTHNDRDYPEWIEIDGEGERFYYIGMLEFANGRARQADVPENCREIYYGAMYGTNEEK